MNNKNIGKSELSKVVIGELKIVKSTMDQVMDVIQKHIQSLAFPMDSYLEDSLYGCEIFCIQANGECIGYGAVSENELQFFHVVREYYQYAPELFERIVQQQGIKEVSVMTQDAQMCALMVEWDYEMRRGACWFTDSGRVVNPHCKAENAKFRTATLNDCKTIREVSGDFFDEESGGFKGLEDRINAGMIFMLEQDGEMLGGGIVELGRLYENYCSIGMFTNPAHRKEGVAKTILLNLKDWAYAHNLIPVAGCWYYNTLSRRSLESAGMIATAFGYGAILKQKDRPSKRTGNPPGELVED